MSEEFEKKLQQKMSEIRPADRDSMEAAKAHWRTVGKPLNSLGKLEEAVIKIETFGNHLRTDQNIGISSFKCRNDTPITLRRSRGVGIQSINDCMWKNVGQSLLYLFGTETTRLQIIGPTRRATSG